MPWGLVHSSPRIARAIESAVREDIVVLAPAISQSNGGSILFPANLPGVFCIGSANGMGDPSYFNPGIVGKEMYSALGEGVLGTSVKHQSYSHDTSLYVCKDGTSIATIVAAGIAAILSDYVKNNFDGVKCVNYELMRKMFMKLSEATLDQPYRYLAPWRVFGAGKNTKALLEKALQPTADSMVCNVLLIDPVSSLKSEVKAHLQQLKDADESIRLLCLLSFLDSSHIPELLWTADPKFQAHSLRWHFTNDASLNLLLTPLINSRLLRRTLSNIEYVSIQESVQTTIRAFLDGSLEDQTGLFQALSFEEQSSVYWIQRAIELVNIAYPIPSSSNLAECELLNANALRVIEFGKKHKVVTRDLSLLVYSMALYTSEREQYEQAYHWFEEALQIQEGLDGVDNVKIVTIINSLGIVKSKLRRYDEAVEDFERCQRIIQRTFGGGSINCAETMDNIGLVYVATQRYDAAIQQFQEARNIKLKNFRSNHSKLVVSESNLGDTYFKMGDFERAISHFNEGLRICKLNFDREHPTTTKMLENLAHSYQTLGNHMAALTLYRSVLRLKQQIVGADHVETADIIHNLGVTSQSMGNFDEAFEFFKRALAVYQKNSQDPVRVANTLKNIANTYSQQGDHDTAIEYFQQALEIEIQEFGLEHVNTANTLSNIGAAYGRIGNFDEAITQCQSALKTTERLRGPRHLDVASIHHNVGMTHLSRGHLKAAKRHFSRSRRIFVATLGENDFKSRRAKELINTIAKSSGKGAKRRWKTYMRDTTALLLKSPEGILSFLVGKSRSMGDETPQRCAVCL